MDALSAINLRVTPQSESADPRQVRNNAGGHVFAVTPETRLRRFLIMGTEGGTFYVGERELTKDNAAIVLEFAAQRTDYLVSEIVQISTSGRALRQNPALFALAAAASLGEVDGRRAALEALPLVARTGTHLFQFVAYAEQFRGWGRALRRAVASWYTDKGIGSLAYQVAKYRHRQDWTHRDVLRLAHPHTDQDARARMFDWICGRTPSMHGLALLEGYTKAHEPGADIPELIHRYGLTREMLPEESLAHASTWEALLDGGMPMTALIRQLPRLTRLGLLSPLGERTRTVCAQLTDAEHLHAARVHPFQALVAHRTYALGYSLKGSSSWNPTAAIVDALDTAFYAAFALAEPTGKRWLLGLDVSGSMTDPISGLPLSAREASAALALTAMKTEPWTEVIAFTSAGTRRNTGITPLPISPRQRLDDAVRVVSGLNWGATDCALPMLYALQKNTLVDVFVVLTDSETWTGNIHPHQALRQYRERMNPTAQLIVLGMTSTGFTIADPTDAGMLDIAGLDAAVPALMADFARGL